VARGTWYVSQRTAGSGQRAVAVALRHTVGAPRVARVTWHSGTWHAARGTPVRPEAEAGRRPRGRPVVP
jgi:hypothetical protein